MGCYNGGNIKLKNMITPAIITNFKVYQSATHNRALDIAKIHDELARETGVNLIVCPQMVDLGIIAKEVDIPVYSQHIDPLVYGSGTGWTLPESVKAHGAMGTLLNHSEHRLEWDTLEESVKRAKDLGLTVVVCAKDPDECEKMNALEPDFIAYEPPELIGGDVSVSTAKPELIKEAVERVNCGLIVGAGVKNGEDVRIALELGAVAVLVASGVTKAHLPKEALQDLISGIKK